jgi:hypothetical protein
VYYLHTVRTNAWDFSPPVIGRISGAFRSNERIQELELIPCQDYYIDVYKLYYEWTTFRKSKKLPVFLEENSILNKLRPDLLQEIIKGRKNEIF